MEQPFKVGDRVICIDDNNTFHIWINHVYIVTNVDMLVHSIHIRTLGGVDLLSPYSKSRFILDIKKQRQEKLKTIYEKP